jgi:hypothetical protein
MERFHLTLMPDQTIVPAPLITLRPQHDIRMTLVERVPLPISDKPIQAAM